MNRPTKVILVLVIAVLAILAVSYAAQPQPVLAQANVTNQPERPTTLYFPVVFKAGLRYIHCMDVEKPWWCDPANWK